jgi:hypothetical protein
LRIASAASAIATPTLRWSAARYRGTEPAAAPPGGGPAGLAGRDAPRPPAMCPGLGRRSGIHRGARFTVAGSLFKRRFTFSVAGARGRAATRHAVPRALQLAPLSRPGRSKAGGCAYAGRALDPPGAVISGVSPCLRLRCGLVKLEKLLLARSELECCAGHRTYFIKV